MKMKIELFQNRLGKLECVPYVSAAFESMAKARGVAFADGKRRGADEISITSMGAPLVRERWVRDGEQWKCFNPRPRYGVRGVLVQPKRRPPE